MFAASKSGSADAKDANFKNVTMLLHGNGTNGAQNNTFVDSSTNNFSITRNGNTTQGTFSPYGSNWSNYFDGSGDYINAVSANTANAMGTGDWTVECWVYKTNSTQGMIFDTLALTGGTTDAIRIYINASNAISFYKYSTALTTGGTVTLNTWNHVAVVRQSGSIKIYLNGTQVNTTYTDTGSNYTCGANRPSSGIDGYDNSSNPFQGYISNLRAVKGTAVYTGSFTPPTAPLTAISGTSLLTCADNRFIDDSTNNFTIIKSGDVSVQRFSPFNATSAYSTSVIGGSGYFDGSGDYLTIPSSSTFSFTGDFTWEAWVYLPATTSGCEIVSKHLSGVTGWYMLSINSSLNVNFVIWNSVNTSSNATSSGSLVVGAWNHVAGGRNGSTVFCCLNGAYTSAALLVTPRTTDNAVNIGMNLDGSSSAVKGYISNLRCVTSAVYTANYTVPTAPLTAITNTQLLLSTTNAGILDNAMMNDLETVGNAQISTSVKKYGTGSMYFDGSGDYLISRASPIWLFSGDWTMEAWIYPNSVTGVQVLVETRNRTTNASPCMYLNGTNLVIDTGTASVVSAGTITISTWQHVAATRSGNSWRIFINGTQVGSTTTNTTSYTTAYGCCIGSSYYNEHYNGYIDDLRITQGLARYTASFTAPAAPYADKG